MNQRLVLVLCLGLFRLHLLLQIRQNAFAYIHGHEVGGTNPSLLEALGSTKLNLLLKVGFNEEVAENAALYWDKSINSLSTLIAQVEKMDKESIELFVNGGERVVTSLIPTPLEADGITFAADAPLPVSVEAHHLK